MSEKLSLQEKPALFFECSFFASAIMKVTETLIYISEIVSSNFLFCQTFVCPPLFLFLCCSCCPHVKQEQLFVDFIKKYVCSRPAREGLLLPPKYCGHQSKGNCCSFHGRAFSQTGIFTPFPQLAMTLGP